MLKSKKHKTKAKKDAINENKGVDKKKMNKTIGHNNTTPSNHIINNWLFWNIKFKIID